MSSGYKTAQELGISGREREALIKTIEVLRAEQIIFDMGGYCFPDREDPDEKIVDPIPLCNTRACIGGTMSLLLQNDLELPTHVTPTMVRRIDQWTSIATRRRVDDSPGVFAGLFLGTLRSDITPAKGIAACQAFLRGSTINPWFGLLD